MGANVRYGNFSNPTQIGQMTGQTIGGFGGGQFLSSLLGVGMSALTGNPLGLLAIILPSLIGGIGAISQGVKSNRYYEDYLNKLEQNKSDMRKSLQARQQAYLGLENIIFGHQISNPYTYGAEAKPENKGSAYGTYAFNRSFRR